jgi:hypothetical protein
MTSMSASPLRARGRFGVGSREPVRRPPSFLGITSSVSGTHHVEAELFVGVTAAEAVMGLQRHARRLPLDVWFSVADQLLATLEVTGTEFTGSGWPGPRAFGVELGGRVVLFAGAEGAPSSEVYGEAPALFRPNERLEWATARLGGVLFGRGASATALALCWLLEPFEVGGGSRWNRTFTDPSLPPAVAEVLLRAVDEDTPVTVLRTVLAALAHSPPATDAQVAEVFFGACPEVLVRRARRVSHVASWLPEAWRGGGLSVAVDQALEGAGLSSRSPVDPRAVRASGQVSVLPTDTLRLEVWTVEPRGRLLQGLTVTAAGGLPPRFPLETEPPLSPGTPVLIRLRHPVQTAVVTDLDGVVTSNGTVERGAARDEGLAAALERALTLRGSGHPNATLPLGRLDEGGGHLVRPVLVSLLAVGAVYGCGHMTPWSLGAIAGALLATIVAVGALSSLVRGWPLGNVGSLGLFSLATLATASQGRSEPALLALTPTFLILAGRCVFGLGRHDRDSTALLASCEWRRAAFVPEQEPCRVCGRWHPLQVRFEECQYTNCRTRLAPRHSCTCDACLELERQAAIERKEKADAEPFEVSSD